MKPKPLSSLCDAWLEDSLCPHAFFDCRLKQGQCAEQSPVICSHCVAQDAEGGDVYCKRPSDDDCPALEDWLGTPEADCLMEDGECGHLYHYDPSPAGISLPAGHLTDCAVDGDPEQCPCKEWEDDRPSVCQKGGV